MKTLVQVILIMILITSLSSDEVTLLNAFIPDFKVNDDVGGVWYVRPSISVDGSGNFIVTWLYEHNGNGDIYAQRYASDGTALGGNFKVNDSSGIIYRTQGKPSVSANYNGDFIITWGDEYNGDYDIYAQRYSTDGTALGSNFKVNDDQGSEEQRSPSISADSIGNFIITWEDERNGNSDIYVQRYAGDGTAFGSNFKVNDDQSSGRQYFPSISADYNGNFTITWGDRRNVFNWEIYAQRYTSDGTTFGSNFKVNDDQGSADHNYPSISIDGGGNFIITWWDGRSGGGDIYAQRYSANGTALDSNFQVNDDQGMSNQWSTKVSANVSGNFIIAWWDERNSNYDIYAQQYANDGTALDSNFRVTDTSVGSQRYPDVKLWNNQIYNTWEDDRAGGTGYDIWANVLDWNDPGGTSVDEQYQIPTAFVLHQNYPNPFNPSTKIVYSLPKLIKVKIEIFNLLGQRIATLLNKPMPPGLHEVEFTAKNLPSGVYLYRISAGEFQQVKKMVLLK